MFDRRLFLPEDWAADEERREEAGVPKTVVFRTKPELALEMVQDAVAAGVPFRWVAGDSVYGDSPTFLQGVRSLNKWYVVDTSSDARVWTSEPTRQPVGQSAPRGGRMRTRARAVEKPITVVEAVAALPATAWKRITVAEGSQGPRIYDYAELTVWFSEEGLPALASERLMVRRSLGQEPEFKYQRSNAPSISVPLKKLAAIGGCRWTIEQGFQAGKGECGLDEYETRGWIGWHHHTALSILALFFLEKQRRRLGKKKSTDDRAGGSRGASSPSRHSLLGRKRNPPLVQLAPRTKSRSQGVSLQATRSRAPAAK